MLRHFITTVFLLYYPSWSQSLERWSNLSTVGLWQKKQQLSPYASHCQVVTSALLTNQALQIRFILIVNYQIRFNFNSKIKLYEKSTYAHRQPVFSSFIFAILLSDRCYTTRCNNGEKYKEVSKNMTYLKNMEIFETKRALQMSAFLMNTVKPNYEINICSISKLFGGF